MKKIVLVASIPDDCYDELSVYYQYKESDKYDSKWKWLGLKKVKPLPEKKREDFMNYWFNKGYNACLEEITK